jgi:MbtH protein
MAQDHDQEDNHSYTVLVNEEEQYCLWPTGKDIPDGWKQVGKEGTRAECAAFVDATWLDMRPLSLRLDNGSP